MAKTRTTVATALQEALLYIYNPEALADVALDSLLDMQDPENSMELSDPADPVVSTIEQAALLCHAAVEHDWNCMTKVYPGIAMTMGDLYRHMSDKDYPDIFSQPAPTELLLLLNKDELFKHAVPPNGTNVRRIVIPRDSQIMVDGFIFTMQYPIEIRILPSGGLQIVQLGDVKSPVRLLETNNIDWDYTTMEVNGKPYECVALRIPVMQYGIKTNTAPLTPGISFKQSYDFEDRFYMARIWMRRDTTWVELGVTHSQVIIDLAKPTAMLMVSGQTLQVKIPDVYVRTGLVSGEIRTDIYTTKGVISLDITGHNSDAFSAAIRDYNGEIDPTLVTPFERLTFKQFYAPEVISGGRIPLTFSELRDRVIDNAVGPKQIPISEKQLTLTLNDMGYTVDKSVDTVTARIFHVSKELTPSSVTDLTTPCGTTNGYVRTKFDDLVKHRSVYDNGQRVTIGPRTLYVDDSNNFRVHDRTVDDVLMLPPVERSEYMNDNRLFFSPFYYVLDTNSDVFESRPYELDTPKLTSKEFVETNISLELDIAIGECILERVTEGYRLRVITRSSQVVKDLKDDQLEVQLCFKSRSNDNWSRVDGKLVGFWGEDKPERVYDFLIKSNMDVDKNHDLIVNNFTVANGQIASQPMELTNVFSVVFGVNRYTTPNYKPGSIDAILSPATDSSKGVTHERLNVVLGHHLRTLWANGRPETGGVEYAKYPVDVIAKQPKTTYVKNQDGTFKTEVVDGVRRLVVEHEIGDIIYEADGVTPMIQYPAGSVIMEDGKPVVANPRGIIRRLEMFLLDGRFAVCDDPAVIEYMRNVKRDLLKSILFDLEALNKSRLEQTDIFIYPRNNMGKVWVRYADNTRNQIPAELEFLFTLSVTEATRTDPVLTAKIKETIRNTVMSVLQDTTVSVSKTLDRIRELIKDHIVDIEMEAFGIKKDQKVYTLTNPKDQLTMGKIAYVNQEGHVSLRDDMRLSWGRLDEDLKK